MQLKSKPVTVPQLISEIGGSMGFGYDGLIKQLSSAEDLREDFTIIHRNKPYVVSYENLQQFFQTTPKPLKEMTLEEENAHLRQQLEKIKQKIGRDKRPETGIRLTQEEAMTPDEVAEEMTVAADDDVEKILAGIPDTGITEIEDDGVNLTDSLGVVDTPGPIVIAPPKRDESIPAPSKEEQARDRMSLEELQKSIKAETTKQKPVKSSDPVPAKGGKK